jgi:uncharacterized protein YaeQ
VPSEASRDLARFAQRTMRLQCTVQDGRVLVADAANAVDVEVRVLKERVLRR